MIATIEIVDLLDQTEHFSKILLQSDVIDEYRQARIQMNNDETAQRLIREFNETKILYDEVQRFGRYHPDYNQIMTKIRSKKRDMDMNELVANFKIAERNVQRLLDDISELIARSVSEQILVPKEGAIFTDGGCSTGGCGSGGACSCNAS